MVARTTYPHPKRSLISIRQDKATKYIMQDVQDVCCVWAHTALLEKYWARITCSVNDPNYTILQLLQVQLVCYGEFHKVWYSKTLLADCTPHGECCWVE